MKLTKKRERKMTYRLNLKPKEHDKLISYIRLKDLEIEDINLKNKIMNPTTITESESKKTAMQKATKKRSENAKLKIENAINIMKMTFPKHKKISYYAIAKEANVAIQTIQKYISLDTLKKLQDEHNSNK